MGGGGSRPMRMHCVYTQKEGGGGGVRAAAYVRIFLLSKGIYI